MSGDAGDGEDRFFGSGDALAAAEVESVDRGRFDFRIGDGGGGCPDAEVTSLEEGTHRFLGGGFVGGLHGDRLAVDFSSGSGNF